MPSSKTEKGLFFYCEQKPSSFAHRMIVVILKMQLECGEIRTHHSQDATLTCKKLTKMRVVKGIFKPSFGRPFLFAQKKTVFILAKEL